MSDFTAFDHSLTHRLAAADSGLLGDATPASFRPFFSPGAITRSGGEDSAHELGSHGAPHVETVQEAGQIRRIIVTCGCGEKIEIDCEY